MNRSSAIASLRAHEADLRRFGVTRLYLFGSVAREEGRSGSDVDIFYDHVPGLGLAIVSIRDRLSEILGAPVDATTRLGLHPALRPDIERSAIQVF